jgi:TolA-binding protein
VDRITRKGLKGDKFAQEVGQTVTFFEEHKNEIIRYGVIALAVAVLAVGYTAYSRRQHDARQAALYQAIEVQETPVGPAQQGAALSFPTQEAKDAQALKLFGELKIKYSGSDEADVAEYYMGSILADQGKLQEAEKSFQSVVQSGSKEYASLAKYALAQLCASDGRLDQAEKSLRELMDKPTAFVSQDQATLALVRVLAKRNPAEARKLLQPLMTKPGGAGQVAIALMSEIQQ